MLNNNDITQMKAMIGSLAGSVKTLSRQQSAPSDQIKECQQLTIEMKSQQCDGDGKKQGVIKQQNLLDELARQVKFAADLVASAKAYRRPGGPACRHVKLLVNKPQNLTFPRKLR